MTSREARSMLPGTVVMWDNDPENSGVVRELGRNGFYTNWQDGQAGWIDFQDADKVGLWQPVAHELKEKPR